MRDGTSLLDKLFPGAPPHNHQKRVGHDHGGFAQNPAYMDQSGKNAREDIPTRWAAIYTLDLRGLTHQEIADALKMTSSSISRIVNDERYVAYCQARLAELDKEFVAMKPLAFAALKGALGSADENTALRASETWFKGAGFGGYSKREQQSTTLSAEDIAQALLRQGSAPLVQVNTQVNVSADARDTTGATATIDASRTDD